MCQRKALLALAMLLALLAFNTQVQAKGGRGGGGGRSGGHRSSSGGGGFFSGWGSKSKSSSSSNSGGGSGSSNGGGFFSNWGWGAKSKSSSTSSQKNIGSSSSHSSPSKPHEHKHDLHKSAPPIGWNVDANNNHLHHPIMSSSLGHNHVNAPSHRLHAVSYPRQPVFMSSSVPGAPPPPPPPYGGYYASSSSLPVGATFYPQVPRTSSDSGFGSGFFAGAYGQSILNRLSHVHYYGGHRSVIHNHDNNYNDNNSNNKNMNNNSTIDRIIIVDNNPTITGDLEQATKTTTIPLELGVQFNQTQPILRNEQENTNDYIIEANSTNLPTLTDATAIITNTVNTDGVDVNATTTAATLKENISTVASNDVANNSINTVAAPGGIICFPSMVNETDAEDPSKVLQVEKILCFPAEPPVPTVEELKIIQEQQPPEQPTILKEDVQYLDIILSGGVNNKGSFQLSSISVFLLISLY